MARDRPVRVHRARAEPAAQAAIVLRAIARAPTVAVVIDHRAASPVVAVDLVLREHRAAAAVGPAEAASRAAAAAVADRVRHAAPNFTAVRHCGAYDWSSRSSVICHSRPTFSAGGADMNAVARFGIALTLVALFQVDGAAEAADYFIADRDGAGLAAAIEQSNLDPGLDTIHLAAGGLYALRRS